MPPHPHLKDIYTRENPLQALNATAADIEQKTGVAVLRCHLGNPTAPAYQPADQAMAEHILHRNEDDENTGYLDVDGPPQWRQVIANALTLINRLPKGSIDYHNVIGANGGTGALNLAFQVAKDPAILVSEPFYPPWMEIAKHTKERDIRTFALDKDYLLDVGNISGEIDKVLAETPGKSILLLYHYPHNPSGKTLTEEEAKTVGERLNALCAKYPSLYLVQEDLYLGTIAPEMGIYTPLPYLDEKARKRTMWIHSGSKIGHARDRAAVICAFNDDLLKRIRGCNSYDILGSCHHNLIGLGTTLVEIAHGGVDAEDKNAQYDEKNPRNYRYQTAEYYQKRLKTVVEGIQEIEKKINFLLLPDGVPKGTYYLYPSFEFLRGASIPSELAHVFGERKTFENADDVALALQNAHLL
ncbi:MAG: pyridoxal phosphate-dependent aminotransferase, partial [Pseudomonadota bacterium]|nr:pyridoxal phosphate-dependent aminotransferase [Pseudomonadota bacterium]